MKNKDQIFLEDYTLSTGKHKIATYTAEASDDNY